MTDPAGAVLRYRVMSSGPVRAVRTVASRAMAPVLRSRLDAAVDTDALLGVVRVAIPGGGSHQIPQEIRGFVQYAAERRPAVVCEIGTAAGGTTIVLSRLAPEVRKVATVDLQIVNKRVMAPLAREGQELHLVEASSYDPATVERVRTELGEPIDVLFIDGDHRYEGVLADFLHYRRLVRPGGLIAFHDIVPDHQERHGRPTPHWAGGVPRLWRELRERYPSREFVRDPEQDAFGIGVLEHDPAVSEPEPRPLDPAAG